jgi:hypothetical protein
MRRKRAFKRGRLVLIAFAGGVGYLLGGWHSATPHSTDLSPAQSIALRFPEHTDGAVTLTSARDTVRSAVNGAGNMVLGDPQLLLLNPDPMIPQARKAAPPAAPNAVPDVAAAAPRAAPNTIPEAAAAPPLPEVPSPRPAPAAARRTSQTLPPTAALAYRQTARPGFVLNDAQIASIKERLHLTPGQQAMWPAVESALRNIAYARSGTAHRHGATAAQVASLDPDSTEVLGLKAAAIPLLMSFNDEQKSEVRNLAHVMGLDKLASDF